MNCPFKSAEELGLTQPEYKALVKTLILMENDQIIHVPNTAFRHPRNKEVQGKYNFNMSDWNSIYSCGSVCCIGGTADVVGNLRVYEGMEDAAGRLSENGDENLYLLFYRWANGRFGQDPTPKQAAEVLREYLTTGKTRW